MSFLTISFQHYTKSYNWCIQARKKGKDSDWKGKRKSVITSVDTIVYAVNLTESTKMIIELISEYIKAAE